MVRVFIQARMSSKRFPGKVLAPFNGIPILTCVIERVDKVILSSRDTVLGINSRMSEMQVAIDCQQLTKVNQILELRADNFAQLKASLSGINGISILDTDHPNKINLHYCLSVILHDDFKDYRDSIIAGLKKAGVGTSIYYPHPVQRLT